PPGRRRPPSGRSAARGRGGRPLRPTRRTCSRAAPWRRGHACACPSETRPRGSEAPPRGSRRSRAPQGPLRDLGRFVERRPLDLASLVHLEDVALAEVVEPVEQDAALEALADLANVVLEALQLRD